MAKRKCRAWFTALTLSTMILSGSSVALADIATDKNFSFEFDGDESYVLGYKGKDEEIEIPETLGGATVTEIKENALEGNGFIRKVVLPETVESIGEKAFADCKALTEIVLPDSLTYVKKNAFEGSALTTVYGSAVSIAPMIAESLGITYVEVNGQEETEETEEPAAEAVVEDEAEVEEANVNDEMAEKAAAEEAHQLIPYQTKNLNYYSGEDRAEYFTMMGVKYYSGLVTHKESEVNALYHLDSKADSVSFEVGHIDQEPGGECTLYVYLDNKLVQTVELSENMTTQKVELDVTGYDQMRLLQSGNYNSRYGYANMNVIGKHNYTKEISRAVSVDADGEYLYTCTDCGFTKREIIPKQNNCVPYLKPYQTSHITEYYEKWDLSNAFYVMGDPYTEGFTTDHESTTSAVYNLGKAYSSVSFMVGHLDDNKNGDKTLKVFGDQKLLKEVPLTGEMASQKVKVNTEGILQLEIVTEGNYNSNYCVYDMSYESTQALNHDFEETIELEATETSTGIANYICRNCGVSYSDVIPKLSN